MFFSPEMDEEWRDWYTSPSQKLARRFEEALGLESVATFMGLPITTAAKMGVIHKIPYFFLGLGIAKNKRRPYIVAGLLHTCTGLQLSFLNKSYTLSKRDCAGCNEETQRFEEAKERIINAVNGEATETPPPAKGGKRKGALLDWPTG